MYSYGVEVIYFLLSICIIVDQVLDKRQHGTRLFHFLNRIFGFRVCTFKFDSSLWGTTLAITIGISSVVWVARILAKTTRIWWIFAQIFIQSPVFSRWSIRISLIILIRHVIISPTITHISKSWLFQVRWLITLGTVQCSWSVKIVHNIFRF